jgi:hypothetical protein
METASLFIQKVGVIYEHNGKLHAQKGDSCILIDGISNKQIEQSSRNASRLKISSTDKLKLSFNKRSWQQNLLF